MYFAAALGSIVLVVCAACYAIARGALREAAAGRLQSDFVSAVSHEFRSPLTTLRQLTELLAHGRISDETRRRQYFDVLQQETLRLHQLVEDLLDFGRMDAGRREYRIEPVDLHELIRDGIDAYRSESTGNGHAIELSADQHVLIVDADREALQRVVRNLLENAVKYSPDRPRVWVEARADGHGALLRVRDEGIGIPPARAWTYLREVRAWRCGEAGLYSRHWYRPGDGEGDRRGAPGRVGCAERSGAWQHIRSMAALAPGGRSRPVTRILVVEDEPGIALGLEDDLRMEGWDVELIGDGAAASRRARE